MQIFLQKHGPGVAAHRLKMSGKREKQEFTFEFEVLKRDSTDWHVDAAFTGDYQSNWGLWNKDVVEAFLQLRSHPNDFKAPYLEIQLSPLNQPFALVITEPRKTFYAPKDLVFLTESETNGKIWKGKFTVTLPPDLKGDYLYGGFFSCLGYDPREYFAVEPNPETAPDFHRPEFFFPMDAP